MSVTEDATVSSGDASLTRGLDGTTKWTAGSDGTPSVRSHQLDSSAPAGRGARGAFRRFNERFANRRRLPAPDFPELLCRRLRRRDSEICRPGATVTSAPSGGRREGGKEEEKKTRKQSEGPMPNIRAYPIDF